MNTKAGICLTAVLILCTRGAGAQSHRKGWHLLNSSADTSLGIGLDAALKAYPETDSARTVVVAVIDDGVDIRHPDLMGRIWTNPGEIPGNGLDDDANGYTDDVHGWDFLGSASEDIEYDNTELTRLLRDYRKRFEGRPRPDKAGEKAEYARWKKLESEYARQYKAAGKELKTLRLYKTFVDALREKLDSTGISKAQLKALSISNRKADLGRDLVLMICKSTGKPPKEVFALFDEEYLHAWEKISYHLNPDFDSRTTIGDNPADIADSQYGNAEVKGPDARHGTHVAGIIAALQNNGIGADGICSKVQIMVLRVVPNGDERDKDVARAIRYAADNGARIINMSFGKGHAAHSDMLKAAIRYAESKDVLLVHAAGNEHQNNDKAERYPAAEYGADSFCRTWIEVGACDKDRQPADFSNYGRRSVDVFAPGVQIYSTVSDSSYAFYDGTSMAAPVVSGLAALLRSRYPSLTAVQVKQLIEGQVLKPDARVKKPGKKRKKTRYAKLCRTGGIVNAPQTLKAAANLR